MRLRKHTRWLDPIRKGQLTLTGAGLAGSGGGRSSYLIDFFTDADDTLLNAHTSGPLNTPGISYTHTAGSFDIQGGRVNVVSLTGGAARATFDPGLADFNLEIRVCPTTAGNNVGVEFRRSGANDFYRFLVEGNGVAGDSSVRLFKVEGGAQTQIGGKTEAMPNFLVDREYVLRISCRGPSIICSFFGEALANYTFSADNAFNQTATGMALFSEEVGDCFDNLIVERAASGGHATLCNGLISFIRGDEVVSSSASPAFRHDSSPTDLNNVFDAMGTEGPRSVSDGPGGKTAIRFDPTKKQHLICHPKWQTGLAHGGLQDWTIALFARRSGTAARMGLVSQEDGNGGGRVRGWCIDYVESTDRFRGLLFQEDTNVIATASGPGATTEDAWHCLILEHDATANTIQLWQDNVAGTAAGYTTDTPYYTQAVPIRIGTLLGQATGSLEFDGDICLVGFWGRKLTSDEKTAYYASGAGLDPTPSGNYYSRHGQRLVNRLAISFLAGVAKNGTDNEWDAIPGGNHLIHWLSDGSLVCTVGRRPWFLRFNRDGSVVNKHMTTSIGQDKAAYHSKARAASNHVYYGHKSDFTGNDTVYAYNYSTGAIDWSYAATDQLQCLELTSLGLAVGSSGGSGQLDIISYSTGLSIGGGWPKAGACWEQALCCGTLTISSVDTEVIVSNDFTADPTNSTLTVRKVSDGSTVFTKTGEKVSHFDRHILADLDGDGDYELLTIGNTTGAFRAEGDELVAFDGAGTQLWRHTAAGTMQPEVGNFYPELTGLEIAYNTDVDVDPGNTSLAIIRGTDGSLIWSTQINVGAGSVDTGGGQIQIGDYDGDGRLEVGWNYGDNRTGVNPRLFGGWVWHTYDGTHKAMIFGHGWNSLGPHTTATGSAGFWSGQDSDANGRAEFTGSDASIDNAGWEVVSQVELL